MALTKIKPSSVDSNSTYNVASVTIVTGGYITHGDGTKQYTANGGSGSSASGNSITLINTTLSATANGLTLTTGSFSSVGDSIVKDYILRGTTTNATETELLIDGNNRISISSNSTMFYTVDIVGRRTDTTGKNAAFHLKGVAINNFGTASDAGSLYEIVIHRDDATWTVDARANNTTDSINIYVSGAASSNIRWVAYTKTVEVLQ